MVKGRGGGTLLGAFSFTQWLIGLKYPKHITFCDTNIVLIIETQFLPISKKIKLD